MIKSDRAKTKYQAPKMQRRRDPADLRYSRIAWLYDAMNYVVETFDSNQLRKQLRTSKRRKQLLTRVQGKILEVGIGPGQSFKDYPPRQVIVGIDIDEEILRRANEKAKHYNGEVGLLHADVQDLPFEDNTFDTIFTSYVFCSVTDSVKGLKQLKRVLKKDGKILMLEHVRSKNRVLGLLMDILNPLMVRLTGANINRDTIDNIRKAELTIVDEKDLSLDIVKTIQVAKQPRDLLER